ncbi:STN domain-containing protein, partial [Clostridium perfringens]
GRQTGVEIISTERGLHAVRTRALAGPLPVRRALAQLLAGTDFRAVRIAGGGYRIVYHRASARRPLPARSERAEGRDAGGTDIIVTASK